jgi:hypothetical protein
MPDLVRRGMVLLCLAATLAGAACGRPRPGTQLDEARRVGRTADTFPAADEDFFRDMDRGVSARPELVAQRLPFLEPAEALDAFVKVATLTKKVMTASRPEAASGLCWI